MVNIDTRRRWRRAAAIGAFLAVVAFVRATHAADAPRKPFLVFDSTAYAGKPDLAPLGVMPARGTGALWRAGQPRDDVDRIGVQRAVLCCADFDGVFYLDIEHWPIYKQPDDVIDRNVGKFIRMADAVRTAAPHLRFGYYGVLPEIVYWPIVSSAARDELATWRRNNQRAREIARHVDVIFPSLYTFYADEAGWETYARETLQEAKMYGKPVYAFLWPEFHDSNQALRGQNLPRHFWRRQLELCRANADGIVIWGGWQRRWDEDAGWWQETKLFLQSLREVEKP